MNQPPSVVGKNFRIYYVERMLPPRKKNSKLRNRRATGKLEAKGRMRGEGGGAEGLFVCEACTPSLIVLRKLLKASSVSLRNLCCNDEASNATDEKKERGRRRSLRGWGGKLLSRFSKAIYLLAFSCRDSFRFDSSTLDNLRNRV